MKSRLKEGGIATFWLPINQLKLDETKAILRAFHNAFPNASVWANPDEQWIMMGINGPGRKVKEEEIRQLWNNPDSGKDLHRIGIEVPQQLGALFVMDGEEIDRITHDVAPLMDDHPKRLSDVAWDESANLRFASEYMDPPSAADRFDRSPMIGRVWPEVRNKLMISLFAVRETRFLSKTIGTNKLAELDLFLRGSRLRTPVLEALGSNEFRLSIAERIASTANPPPLEILPDLVAGALARRDIAEAIRLLEHEKDGGAFGISETLLLIYLYSLNGSVEKAEALAAANAAAIEKDPSVDWLWEKLKTDFGFHPPINHN
jgi:hypothetical protein